MYYLCRKNKGADQLCGYREADLRLCFRICKSRFSQDVAHLGQLNLVLQQLLYHLIINTEVNRIYPYLSTKFYELLDLIMFSSLSKSKMRIVLDC